MTDNEIIKALECCVLIQGECKECPCDSVMDCDCEDMLLREAFYLINRQKAEIEKKDTEIDILIRKKEALRDEISELTAEIERLSDRNHKCIYLSDDETTEFCVDGACPEFETKAMIKTKAYKRFALKIKMLLETKAVLYSLSDRDCEFAINQATALKAVDTTYKELTEGE